MSPMVPRPFSIEFILLGFLDQKPRHGYDLEQTLKQARGLERIWRVRQNQLYAILQKLETAGLITCSPQPQTAGPIRHVYTLTGAGQLAFNEWLVCPVAHPRQVRQEFLARLYFCMHNRPQAALPLLERQAEVCLAWLDAVDAEMSKLSPGEDFMHFLLDFRRSNILAIQDWLARTRHTVLNQQATNE